jgi:putative DNA primase/helicase
MFEPLDPSGSGGTSRVAPPWRAVMPVPSEVLGTFPSHPLGKPASWWTYRNPAGQRLFVVARFNKADGDKAVLPVTYCEGLSGKREWRWQAPQEPRPLYGLDRLAQRQEAPVLVTEGEKAADAASELFPDHVAITSQGGAGAAGKSDWGPLRGRTVTIWPDNDEGGQNYAADVVRFAHEAGAALVRMVEVPDAFPTKWDAADPPPDDWDVDRLRKLLNAARQAKLVETGPVVEIINGASIIARPVTWLWADWLAEGKLHIMAGAPGTGKTTIAVALAAVLTAGGRWPDRTRAPRGDVLIWSGEDDPSDSLLPRFLASGGDPNRIHFIGSMEEAGERRPFDPSCDFPALIKTARQLPSLRMLLLDPIVSAIAGDSHKNAEVRRGLQPLVDFAAEVGCAVLGITHFTKGTVGREPTERVTGSLAFGALARLVMATAKPAEVDGRRRLVRAKSNIGPDGGGYEYDLIQEPLGGLGFAAQRAIWGKPLEGTARELLNAVEEVEEGSANGAQSAAEAFLRKALARGAMPVNQLKSAAEANCLAWRTVERAKKSLGAVAVKDGMHDGWHWQLADAEGSEKSRRPPTAPEDRQQNSLAAFAENGGLRDAGWEEDL